MAAATACLALLALASPAAMVQDSWLTLTGGRVVATAGIPHHDVMTLWAHGRTWIDQQWLAQLAFYRVYGMGGVDAVLALSAFLGGLAWVGAVALARVRGASGITLLVAAPLTILAAPWAWQARAQSFALPLFVCLLGIVFTDSRAQSARVYLALPLIALWGNLHGTAVLGAAILAIHAALTSGRGLVRSAVLAGGGVLVLTANPYGVHIVSYYRAMTLDPPFASLVQEWQPSTPSLAVIPFYAFAAVALVIAFRKRNELTRTEIVVGLLLLAIAFDAKRSIPWFALGALILVTPLIVVQRVPLQRVARPVRAGVLVGTVGALAVGIASFPHAVSARETASWSTGGTTALGTLASRYPHAHVLADDRDADFVLWELPSLSGRVVADVRFELLNAPELRRLAQFERDPRPVDPGNAQLVVLDPKQHALAPWRANGWRIVYDDASMSVLER
jgi:hypothetical protein